LRPSLPPPTVGVSLFGMKSSHKVTQKLASPNAPWGYTLCFFNLMLDGYTNAAQVGNSEQYARAGCKAGRA
jgi:UDP-galactose transporter B1